MRVHGEISGAVFTAAEPSLWGYKFLLLGSWVGFTLKKRHQLLFSFQINFVRKLTHLKKQHQNKQQGSKRNYLRGE